MTRDHRLSAGDYVRIRNQRWRVERVVSGTGSRLIEVRGCPPGGDRATFVLDAEQIERLPRSRVPRIVTAARWRHLARARLAASVPSFCSLRTLARSRVSIFPFQLEPALAVTTGLATRLLIADAVGTGKTIQAGLIVAEVLERVAHGRVLIVAPASLREQWTDELRQRFDLQATILDGQGLARIGADGPPGGNPWWTSRIGVTSVDYVKRPEVIRALEELVWDVLILDEAHALAGASDRAAAARNLARRARIVVMLSATPHSGDSQTFARLCSTGDLPPGAPLATFRRTRGHLGTTPGRRTCWLRVRVSNVELAMHRALARYARLVLREHPDTAADARLVMMVLRKRACSSAASLVRSLQRRIDLLQVSQSTSESQPLLPFDQLPLDDDAPNAVMAIPGLTNRSAELDQLHQILDIAHEATRRETKFSALQRLLRRTGEPALVFTEYRDTLADLALLLPRAASLHGGLTNRERRQALAGFTAGDVPVLLATDAASEGLNLHYRCRLVINIELPWTPSRLEQRIGRVDRLGQLRRVHAVNLVAGSTQEERTEARLRHRQEHAHRELTDAHTEWHLATSDTANGGEPGATGTDAATDLSLMASMEAERVGLARLLQPDTPAVTDDTVLSSKPRRGQQVVQIYCAARLTFLDGAGDVLWSTLAGARADIRPRRLQRPSQVRQLVDEVWPSIHADVSGLRHSWAAPATVALRRYVVTATLRERAIVAMLQSSSAKLAMVQGGLFDRREERRTAQQNRVLTDALRLCDERLRRLGELAQVHEGAIELVVGIAV